MKHFHADGHRYLRQNFPEAIYAPGKTVKQIISIARELVNGGGPVIATRVQPDLYQKIRRSFRGSKYYESAGIILFNRKHKIGRPGGYICVVTAGTSDIRVAEEAAVTAEILGNRVERVYDVGVAGIHRLFKYDKLLKNASCAVVCAGMEGAL